MRIRSKQLVCNSLRFHGGLLFGAKRNDGFTFIELVMVLGILAILLGLWLPSLTNAKEQERQARCRANLRQIGGAITLYAADFNDALIPSDTHFGHEVWWNLNAVNMGHLITEKYLSTPRSEDHPLYCPSLQSSDHLSKAPGGFVFASNANEPLESRRGFDGWGRRGRIVNVGYEFRVSLSETSSVGLKSVKPNRKFSEVGNIALVSDVISYGTGRFSHDYRYQFARGDGSVDVYQDVSKSSVLQTYDALPETQADIIFLALDRPKSYKD